MIIAIVSIIIAVLNVAFLTGVYFNHIRHNRKAIEDVNKKLDKALDEIHENATAIANIKGRLDNRK